MAVTRAR
jgi:hypothetical protein